MLIRNYVSDLGHPVIFATSGAEALRVARERAPGLVILDIVLPGVDGWHVLGAMRNDLQLSHVPVIITSVLDSVSAGLRLGADEFLVKPFDPQKLLEYSVRLLKPEGCRVLIVEDDRDFGKYLRETLQPLGLAVTWAADGKKAVEWAKEVTFDFIVLDLGLPLKDGWQVLDELVLLCYKGRSETARFGTDTRRATTP